MLTSRFLVWLVFQIFISPPCVFCPNVFVTCPVIETMATTPAWNRTYEAHQMNRGFEEQRNIYISNSNYNKQSDSGTACVNQSSTNLSSSHIDGGPKCPLNANASKSMIGEETEERRSASAWSLISNHTAPSSGKQVSSPASCRNDGRISDPVASCRLFGIDLNSPSVVTYCENTLKSVDVPSGGEVYGPGTQSSGDSEQKSGISKNCGDLKQDQWQLPRKEVNNKQSNLSRSCTKVYIVMEI